MRQWKIPFYVGGDFLIQVVTGLQSLDMTVVTSSLTSGNQLLCSKLTNISYIATLIDMKAKIT